MSILKTFNKKRFRMIRFTCQKILNNTNAQVLISIVIIQCSLTESLEFKFLRIFILISRGRFFARNCFYKAIKIPIQRIIQQYKKNNRGHVIQISIVNKSVLDNVLSVIYCALHLSKESRVWSFLSILFEYNTSWT